MEQSSCYFPLRWESTGDQWWYASPIDWAAADGHYDIVRQLLHLDPNLLIKLTSLRRIRRLEALWDDDARFADAARHRASVARCLLLECECRNHRPAGGGENTLLRAGYGGWVLYMAAAAGDVAFVQELLSRDPLLVFGEGEYGVTDMFYAAARGGSADVFRLLLDHAMSPRCSTNCRDGESGAGRGSVFRLEMMSRAVHAVARGGSVEMLMELLEEGRSAVSVYLDVRGSTVLHAAAGRGQLQVRHLLRCHCLQTSFPDALVLASNMESCVDQLLVCAMQYAMEESSRVFCMLRILICLWFFILNARFNVDLVKMNFIENIVELLHNGLKSNMFLTAG